MYKKKNLQNCRIKENLYLNWQETARAAAKLGIYSEEAYWKNFQHDPSLPAIPAMTFHGAWPGWNKFFEYAYNNAPGKAQST